MKAVVAAFNQEKALVLLGAFSVLTNLRMELFQALSVMLGTDNRLQYCNVCVCLVPGGGETKQDSAAHAAAAAAISPPPPHPSPAFVRCSVGGPV